MLYGIFIGVRVFLVFQGAATGVQPPRGRPPRTSPRSGSTSGTPAGPRRWRARAGPGGPGGRSGRSPRSSPGGWHLARAVARHTHTQSIQPRAKVRSRGQESPGTLLAGDRHGCAALAFRSPASPVPVRTQIRNARVRRAADEVRERADTGPAPRARQRAHGWAAGNELGMRTRGMSR